MPLRKLLVAVDGSEPAWRALEVAADLAKSHDGEVIALHVLRPIPVQETLHEFAAAEHTSVEEKLTSLLAGRLAADPVTRHARRRLQERGFTNPEALAMEGDPASAILDFAKGHNVDAIVLGSRGRGDLAGLLLGSVSHKLAHLAKCACIIVR